MPYDQDRHHRRSIRLQGYDYSQAGAYFVTMCAWERECLFGEITAEGNLQLNEYGQAVETVWESLPDRFQSIDIDAFVIMPNHVHAIIVIAESVDHPVGAIHELPLQRPLDRRKMLLPKMLGYFKMNAAKQINLLRQTPGIPVWQRNYYERVIRDEAELNSTRQYIASNPTRWADDQDNPAVWKNVQR
jgi:REP element-mobilizing transposase RayT